MACPSSGEIKITDLVSEFGGDVPHAITEYYRDGTYVPGNNTDVPTSGAVSLTDFYSAVNEILITLSSDTENYQCATAFNSASSGSWTSTVPKRLVINNGVLVGGTQQTPAITIDAQMAGTLTIQNSGQVMGTAGAAGAAGGNAILVSTDASSSITWNNLSGAALYGGGGGGGAGGAGGDGGAGGAGGTGGQGQTTQNQGSGHNHSSGGNQINQKCHYNCTSKFGGSSRCNAPGNSVNSPGTCNLTLDNNNQANQVRCGHCVTDVATSGGAGGSGGTGGSGAGAGGAGGRGAGYLGGGTQDAVSAASGSSGSSGGSGTDPGSNGSAGGTNAGAGGAGGDGGDQGGGGTGGTGGALGATGSTGATGTTGGTGDTGATGANGNSSNGAAGANGNAGSAGSSGSSGGLAGYYIQNISYLTLNNSGTVAGRS